MIGSLGLFLWSFYLSALGATEQLPKEERMNLRRDYLLDRIGVMLGGRGDIHNSSRGEGAFQGQCKSPVYC